VGLMVRIHAEGVPVGVGLRFAKVADENFGKTAKISSSCTSSPSVGRLDGIEVFVLSLHA
jgi:hypothetical protein